MTWTLLGISRMTDYFYKRNGALPTNFYGALLTAAVAPTEATTTPTGLTQITAGNGYTTGGIIVPPSIVGFTSITTTTIVTMVMKDLQWTAAGGPIPLSGGGARYLILTDDNGTFNSREVYAFWDLTSDRSVSDTQNLNLNDFELRGDTV